MIEFEQMKTLKLFDDNEIKYVCFQLRTNPTIV